MLNSQPDVACIQNLPLCQKEENHHHLQPQRCPRRETDNEMRIIKRLWTPMMPLSPPLSILTTTQPKVIQENTMKEINETIYIIANS